MSGGRVPLLTGKTLPKWEKLRKEEKNQEKEEKLGRKGKNWEGSSTFAPILTGRAGYATGCHVELFLFLT